ncbi:MAG TPA: NAD-dependent epimerase/dehydratase family protein [Bryobacteraceae bacterium]|nr:NAD-dependent epimerase/dehydratase family protein [Bryobacteraceae bacterium]
MKIVITGVCGFAGRNLAQCLLENTEGLSIWGVDNLMRAGSETNRLRLKRLGVHVIHGDLRNVSDLEALPKADWVIDAAASPSVLAGVEGAGTSRQLFEHNLASLVNVLEYSKTHGAGLMLLSTSRVYSIAALASLPLETEDHAFRLDDSKVLPHGVSACGIDPDFSTEPPISLYGSTKLASEKLALEYGMAFGFPVWIDRCGVLAGAGQFGTPDQGIFSYWINAHLRRRPLRYIGFGGTGYQVRDAFHPRDLAALLRAQMSDSRVGGRRTYTVGGGPASAMSLAQLTRWCDARFGHHQPQAEERPRRYDVPWVVMDSRHVANDFGWRCTRPLPHILEEIASHAEQHPEWLELSGA